MIRIFRRNPDLFAIGAILALLTAGFVFSRLHQTQIRIWETRVKQHEVQIERMSKSIADHAAAHAEQINKQLERKFGKPNRVFE